MHTYRLVDDFVDAEAEQALLASLLACLQTGPQLLTPTPPRTAS